MERDHLRRGESRRYKERTSDWRWEAISDGGVLGGKVAGRDFAGVREADLRERQELRRRI
jgi:hypothetical protein